MVGGLLQKIGWGRLWVVLGLREMIKVRLRGGEVLVRLEWLGVVVGSRETMGLVDVLHRW